MIASEERKRQAAKRARIADESLAVERARAERRAIRHISDYFSGVPLPEGFDLLSKRYVDLCLGTDTCSAVGMVYEAMREQGRFQGACGDGTMGEDVRLVIRLLKGIRAKCVPQELSPGILLMHLEIVEGLKF